jgi:tripartite-type tricarboxylate transporter receptor subunit TctC
LKELNVRAIRTLVLFAAALCGLARAADFPTRTITIIDAYPPGGSTDVLSRVLGEYVSKEVGQPVIVQARPGASGTIGAGDVARARPDGYTIFIGNPGPNAIAASAYEKLPYDVVKGFSPILVAATVPIMLCVPANSPVHSVKDLIALGRGSAPSNFGSTGTGAVSHLVGELLNREAKTHFQHVAYKGGAPLSIAISTGEVELGILTGGDAIANDQAGKIRCIATAGEKRSPFFPNAATLAESGFPTIKVDVWLGYLAPAGTPRPVIERLNKAFNHALAMPDIKPKLDKLSMVAAGGTPEEFARRIKEDRDTYAKVVKAIGLHLN